MVDKPSLCRTILRRAAFLAFFTLEAANSTARAGEPLDQWIHDLGSDLYLVRERATENLVGVGRKAITPLGLVANGNDLEVATRAVRILLQLSEDDDANTAETAIKKISQLTNRPIEQAAAAAMLARMREKRAWKVVESLGGVKRVLPDRYNPDPQSGFTLLILDESWQGGDEGLDHVSEIRSLHSLSILNTPITDHGVQRLHSLKELTRLQLYNTNVTPKGVATLKKLHPNTEVDHRLGAFLGVSCLGHDQVARVRHVVKHSAAEKAGLKPGDVITKFNGRDVNNFGSLTVFIGKHRPGEVADLEFFRDGHAVKKKIRFGRWANTASMASLGQPPKTIPKNMILRPNGVDKQAP